MSSNRFDSFAPERSSNIVKWHVDGHDFLYAVSEMLESAQKSIFILDWWLSPELYLRRPPSDNEKWRLDRVLKRKAEQGVKIFVAVYREWSAGPAKMPMNSEHMQKTLEALHSNIKVVTSPTITNVKALRWSHHEKVVVVDNRVASIGGLDLCYGRWDTNAHPLADVNPFDVSRSLFPGQDYNNAREKDFKDVQLYMQNTVSVLQVPRMPWHDVHMTFTGPSVQDVVDHFVQRWKNIAPNSKVNAIEAFTEVPNLSEPKDPNPAYTCNVQVVRSAARWSQGLGTTEISVQNAYIDMINKAEHHIYIENQFFLTISKSSKKRMIKNGIADALYNRIVIAAEKEQDFKIVVVIPEVPGFAGEIMGTDVQTIMIGQYRSINRGGDSLIERLKERNIDADQYIRFYHLRTYDRIDLESVQLIEKDSNIKYNDIQAAFARVWAGADAKLPSEISVPQPVQGTGRESTTKVPIPSMSKAEETISTWEKSAAKVKQSRPEPTPEAELASYVTEQVYIHTKLMIVDDRRVIMGSANINDRSMLGERDSEICLIVENETNDVDSTMAGKPWKAGRFASSLRRWLYREHLGLLPTQKVGEITSFMHPAPVPADIKDDQAGADPLGKIMDIWEETAANNRAAFDSVFKTLPSDSVLERKDYRLPGRFGHVAGGVSLEVAKDQLSKVRGTLVTMPLRYMINNPKFLTLPAKARLSEWIRDIYYSFPRPWPGSEHFDPEKVASEVLDAQSEPREGMMGIQSVNTADDECDWL